MNLSELKIGSDLYAQALDLRYALFFQPHNLPRDILIDDYEKDSTHIALVINDSLVAYGRLTHLGKDTYQLSQIVVTAKEQHNGYGSVILRDLIERAKNKGAEKIFLNARTTATELYEKQGFIRTGEVFLSKSTGVPHIQMLYSP